MELSLFSVFFRYLFKWNSDLTSHDINQVGGSESSYYVRRNFEIWSSQSPFSPSQTNFPNEISIETWEAFLLILLNLVSLFSPVPLGHVKGPWTCLNAFMCVCLTFLCRHIHPVEWLKCILITLRLSGNCFWVINFGNLENICCCR